MRAMVFEGTGPRLILQDVLIPKPSAGQVRIAVETCGVCRTDLHIVDGDLTEPRLPLVPGHEIIGRVDEIDSGVEAHLLRQRVSMPWLGHTCGACACCRSRRENLCDAPGFRSGRRP